MLSHLLLTFQGWRATVSKLRSRVLSNRKDSSRTTGPYDAIHVGAAAPTLPQPLVDQLAMPGRMFIPVGTSSQVILQVDKDAEGKVTQQRLLDVMVSE